MMLRECKTGEFMIKISIKDLLDVAESISVIEKIDGTPKCLNIYLDIETVFT